MEMTKTTYFYSAQFYLNGNIQSGCHGTTTVLDAICTDETFMSAIMEEIRRVNNIAEGMYIHILSLSVLEEEIIEEFGE